MTIFAGIVCRSAGDQPPSEVCDALRGALSRSAGDVVSEFRYPNAWFAKVDIGAFASRGVIADLPGPLSMLAGEPLLETDHPDVARSRGDDLEELHASWAGDDWRALRRARGAYCAAHYDPARSRLLLIADKLALRPIYYRVDADRVVFATALRVVERSGPTEVDLRAVTEMATLGVALSDRTPYANVRALLAGEVLAIDGAAGIIRHQYWRWDDVAPSDRPPADLVRQAYDRFQSAVSCRLRGETSATAFLSGGLDSRCVVTALRTRGVRVRTFNFGIPGTQDEAFGSQYARAIGTDHVSVPMPLEGDPNFSVLMSASLGVSLPAGGRPADSRMAWSGDGGSVGTGHTYQTREMVDDLRAGRVDAAVDRFVQQQGARLARRMFRPDIAERLASVPREGIHEELDGLHCADAGRKLHIFLLLNDQRRHLWNHFEDVDRHRVEFQLPFFDSQFITAMLEVPIDRCLYHAFYADWLDCFAPVIKMVPWQAYPGHLPCPIMAPDNLVHQWETERIHALRTHAKSALLRRANELMDAKAFPHEIMNRHALRLASWVYRAGAADYGYVIRQASLFYSYWSRSSSSQTAVLHSAGAGRSPTSRGDARFFASQ
jgi:hypothetical protein